MNEAIIGLVLDCADPEGNEICVCDAAGQA